ncbi:hypothetical protein BV25DRAFT_726354 [Artomyces pyxidatus]|uniref:Uncharacterized protein n=1 Tax=Artomyces pyxidatus TaxID=48021 RepID=A0ACB8T0B8_9AGAM|nr:hypothetical protein BV25DRAFT_726354 [Artomyces pyxidatus]
MILFIRTIIASLYCFVTSHCTFHSNCYTLHHVQLPYALHLHALFRTQFTDYRRTFLRKHGSTSHISTHVCIPTLLVFARRKRNKTVATHGGDGYEWPDNQMSSSLRMCASSLAVDIRGTMGARPLDWRGEDKRLRWRQDPGWAED